ncbi:MAG TPA: hypothetical protein EYP60_07635 [bacterium (Candidatus Stahlbacteria)]|nr:hypothetical protein [Candidatus Stahlbacteria bacterium]
MDKLLFTLSLLCFAVAIVAFVKFITDSIRYRRERRKPDKIMKEARKLYEKIYGGGKNPNTSEQFQWFILNKLDQISNQIPREMSHVITLLIFISSIIIGIQITILNILR